MQISSDIRECVAFLFYKKGEFEHIIGTCFFINASPPDEPEIAFGYAVTARHVIEDIDARSPDGMVHIRTNAADGGLGIFVVPTDKWVVLKDTNIDVAVLQMSLNDLRLTTHRSIPDGYFLTPRLNDIPQIGPCDEVFFPGLFSQHAGTERNIPIVRRGTIAAVPQEKINTKRMGKIHAYLLESRSIGGLSGSPVFACVGEKRRFEVEPASIPDPKPYYLIGLIQGHFDSSDSVNMGIAIAVPIGSIINTLDAPELVESRASKILEYRAKKNASAL